MSFNQQRLNCTHPRFPFSSHCLLTMYDCYCNYCWKYSYDSDCYWCSHIETYYLTQCSLHRHLQFLEILSSFSECVVEVIIIVRFNHYCYYAPILSLKPHRTLARQTSFSQPTTSCSELLAKVRINLLQPSE